MPRPRRDISRRSRAASATVVPFAQPSSRKHGASRSRPGDRHQSGIPSEEGSHKRIGEGYGRGASGLDFRCSDCQKQLFKEDDGPIGLYMDQNNAIIPEFKGKKHSFLCCIATLSMAQLRLILDEVSQEASFTRNRQNPVFANGERSGCQRCGILYKFFILQLFLKVLFPQVRRFQLNNIILKVTLFSYGCHQPFHVL
jgi:hypothetical protein